MHILRVFGCVPCMHTFGALENACMHACRQLYANACMHIHANLSSSLPWSMCMHAVEVHIQRRCAAGCLGRCFSVCLFYCRSAP